MCTETTALSRTCKRKGRLFFAARRRQKPKSWSMVNDRTYEAHLLMSPTYCVVRRGDIWATVVPNGGLEPDPGLETASRKAKVSDRSGLGIYKPRCCRFLVPLQGATTLRERKVPTLRVEGLRNGGIPKAQQSQDYGQWLATMTVELEYHYARMQARLRI